MSSPAAQGRRSHVNIPFAEALKSDIPSSIVVALVALPLCLGIALASGAPLIAGLIAGVVGGLLVAPLSGSNLMVSGPAAGLTAVMIQAIAKLGSFEAVTIAVALGGVLQLGLGLVKAGVVARYIPSAVIRGMLTAIGLLLILKQVPHLVGYDKDAEGDFDFQQADGKNTFTELFGLWRYFLPGPLIAGVSALALLLAWDKTPLKKQKIIPAALGAVVVGVSVSFLLKAMKPEWAIGAEHLVQIPALGTLVEQAKWPDFSALLRADVIKVAVTLAIVASLETLLSLEATDKLDPLNRYSPPDRELIAQGVGNTVSGLLGGLPITGVIVRSSANVNAGGRTKLSAIFHGILLLVSVLVIPGVLNTIPLSALAAVLIQTGFKLTPPKVWKHAWKTGREHFIPFAVTVFAILFSDLLVGICIGLCVGVFFILREHAQAPALVPVGPQDPNASRYQMVQQVTFLARSSVQQVLEQTPDGARIEIDASQTRRIDPDILELLHEFKPTAKERNIDYRLVGLPEPTPGSASLH